jgi:CelD/BcsL family acetyltransferase involved in cellulose biosynthesis
MNFAFAHEALSPPASAVPPRLSRVDVLQRVEDADSAWRALEQHGSIGSPYQRRDWVALWQRHVAPAGSTTPLIVIGYDEHNVPLFLWPLASRRIGLLNVATFIGGKHATLNFPAWRVDYAQRLSAGELNQILERISRSHPGLDLLLLLNQPAEWNGLTNPFSLLPHQHAAEDNFRLTLSCDPDPVAANIGQGMRRRLRKKENQLAKLPGYRYRRASLPSDPDRLLDAFFVQKAAHLAEQGRSNVFANPSIQAFVRAACRQGLETGRPLIELHALETDNEMLALFAGIHDGRRFTLAFNSMTRGPQARHSPGLVLLQHIIADCARRGFKAFDIGPGDARYKTYFCKEREPVIDSVLPLSVRGHIATPIIRAMLGAKSRIKRTPQLWNALLGAKRRLRGQRDTGEAENS